MNIEAGISHNNEKSWRKKVADRIFWANFIVANVAILHDLTLQELVREQQAKGLHLGQIPIFINDNFVGDISNAAANLLGGTVLAEIVNLSIQKSPNIGETGKRFADQVRLVTPYLMATLFIVVAIDTETAQQVFNSGTPDHQDLWGAAYGTGVFLVSSIKLRNKVFPKGGFPPQTE